MKNGAGSRFPSMKNNFDAGDMPAVLAGLVDRIRPDDPSNPGQAEERIAALAAAFAADPAWRSAVGDGLREWIRGARATTLFAEAGVLSTRGFLAEIGERLYERVLPAPPRAGDLRDGFDRIFHEPGDAQWVPAVPLEAWERLLAALALDPEDVASLRDSLARDLANALEVLVMRIAGEALQSELLHVDPDGQRHDSPFLALQREVAAFVAQVEAYRADAATRVELPDHAFVMLDQCRDAVARLRRIGRERGTSVRITYLLERMAQQLRRTGILLRVMAAPAGEERRRAFHELFVRLVRASATRLQVRAVWRANTRLIATRVTENASRTGEHYATQGRAEYFAMMRAAMGAGVLIALMALLKIQIKALHLPPLFDTIAVCADYAMGFVVIHILHLTVATKQPAMTAATIAATVEEVEDGRAKLDGLVTLIASVVRTQLVAIFGNIALALPLAIAISWAYVQNTGAPPVGVEKAEHMLHELHPVAGWALLHAAIAGVWLFVAGLVSGWYDNRCAVLDIPGRLRGSPLLRWLSADRRERFAAYVDGNLGALMGNAIFGVLLGATGFIGVVTGLPIDIRHVAFGSANLGYATVTMQLGAGAFVAMLGFVLLVGLVNLAVSFALALNLALRARDVTFGRAGELARETWGAFRRDPRSFLLPPKA